MGSKGVILTLVQATASAEAAESAGNSVLLHGMSPKCGAITCSTVQIATRAFLYLRSSGARVLAGKRSTQVTRHLREKPRIPMTQTESMRVLHQYPDYRCTMIRHTSGLQFMFIAHFTPEPRKTSSKHSCKLHYSLEQDSEFLPVSYIDTYTGTRNGRMCELLPG